MPLSPSLSQDLTALTSTYAHTVQSIIDLGRSLRPGDTERETDCPGWTVHDQFAHIVSMEAWVQGESAPEIDVSGREHVRTELDTLIERYLESRRERPLEELIEELEELAQTRLAHLEAETTSPDDPATGPFGPTTLVGLMQNRIFDLWNHEQDIREAIERPGNLDSPGAAHMVRTLFADFPGSWPGPPRCLRARRSSSTSPDRWWAARGFGWRNTTASRTAYPCSSVRLRSMRTSSPRRSRSRRRRRPGARLVGSRRATRATR